MKSLIRLAAAHRRGQLREHFDQNRRRHLVLGTGNVLLVSLFLYGWLIESRWVENTHHRVSIDARTPTPPLRIVHLSDLHIEAFGEKERTALRLVAAAKPDLICLTGDYANSSKPNHISPARRFVRELSAPYGVYATLGNWDFHPKAIFDGSRIELLADRSVDIEVRDVKIRLTGIRFGLPPSIMDQAPPNTLNILLHHDPDYLEEASGLGYDLYLSGHTHGGQIRLPGLGAIIRMSERGYDAGLYSMGKTRMYVSRGLGAEGGPLPEIRFFCRPEVTVLDIEGNSR